VPQELPRDPRFAASAWFGVSVDISPALKYHTFNLRSAERGSTAASTITFVHPTPMKRRHLTLAPIAETTARGRIGACLLHSRRGYVLREQHQTADDRSNFAELPVRASAMRLCVVNLSAISLEVAYGELPVSHGRQQVASSFAYPLMTLLAVEFCCLEPDFARASSRPTLVSALPVCRLAALVLTAHNCSQRYSPANRHVVH